MEMSDKNLLKTLSYFIYLCWVLQCTDVKRSELPEEKEAALLLFVERVYVLGPVQIFIPVYT